MLWHRFCVSASATSEKRLCSEGSGWGQSTAYEYSEWRFCSEGSGWGQSTAYEYSE